MAHDAPCDLLIVSTVGEGGAGGRYATVLIGTDGSPTAARAVRRGFELAEIVGATVTLVFVGDELEGRIALEDARQGQPGMTEARTVGRSINDLAGGEGGVVMAGVRKVAAYRDPSGTIHAFSPRCTHLGCSIGWNDAAKTWDCPCHGSRYSHDGEVIQGPAQKGLVRIDMTTTRPPY